MTSHAAKCTSNRSHPLGLPIYPDIPQIDLAFVTPIIWTYEKKNGKHAKNAHFRCTVLLTWIDLLWHGAEARTSPFDGIPLSYLRNDNDDCYCLLARIRSQSVKCQVYAVLIWHSQQFARSGPKNSVPQTHTHTQYTQLAHFAIRSSIPPFKTVNHIYSKQLATARQRETIDCMILRLEIDRLGSFWSMINVFLNSGRPLLRDNRQRHAVSVTNFVDNDVSTTRLLKLSEHHQSPFGYGPSLFTACYGVFMFVCVRGAYPPACSFFVYVQFVEHFIWVDFELLLLQQRQTKCDSRSIQGIWR